MLNIEHVQFANGGKENVRYHRCVWNHKGSSKLMESTAEIQAIKEMISQKTPVEVIEGDGDNTVISRIENELGVRIKNKNLIITIV